MEFFCTPSQRLDTEPTPEELQLTGGILHGTFALNNGAVAYSPSGACKACLNRDGATNEWQGPKHLFVKYNGSWMRYDVFNALPENQPN